ncbi:MAG: BON domain-containing protein [Bacteroidia bacterium]
MKTDIEIQHDIEDDLKWETFLNNADIGITVKNGIATLSGVVNSYDKMIAAEKTAKNAEGIIAVDDEIEVILSEGDWNNDSELAGAIFNIIMWYSGANEERIKVNIDNGWLILEGEMGYIFENDRIINALDNLMIVKKLTLRI